MQRKIVFWINQGHFEGFVNTPNGWVEADCLDWQPGTYKCVDIRASDADFGARKDGCVCI